jgi:hypothetical protein
VFSASRLSWRTKYGRLAMRRVESEVANPEPAEIANRHEQRTVSVETSLRQAHEAELAEPGDPPTSSIVGTPEW